MNSHNYFRYIFIVIVLGLASCSKFPNPAGPMREPVSLPPSRTSTPTFAVSATPSQTHAQISPTPEISILVPTPTSAMPTGKIVFEVDSGVSGIYTMRADGSELSPIHLNSPDNVSKSPKWTADGTGVVFRTSEGNDGIHIHGLWIMDEDGADKRRLTYKNSDDYDFSFSPDGDRIVYASAGSQPDDSDWMGLYIVEIHSGRTVTLTSQAGYLGNPVWSPDGKWIAYLASDDDSDAYDLYLMNESGKDSRKINGDFILSKQRTSISWSPDSKSLTTVCVIEGNRDICIFPIDGTAPVRLTSSSNDEEHPSWSPDGRSIAYVSYQNINGDLCVDFYTVNIDDLSIIKLTDFPPSDHVFYTPPPIWSPDGDYLAIVSQQGISSNRQAILLINLNNNEIIQISPEIGLRIGSFDWVGDTE
jgi:Tol biopolymer transport system component